MIRYETFLTYMRRLFARRRLNFSAGQIVVFQWFFLHCNFFVFYASIT